ncbi:hypothetical protein GCM10023231_30200 [Olivibacter ginsenosidimutans]|uniref:Uncharacterized protein n=1 Tax=Olivibacter ginsenosidimutans TaxID=1176537 RepID=A0ABP9BTG2_9SPHI
MIRIVEKKIDQLRNNKLPDRVLHVEEQIRHVIPGAILRSQLYRQFPNYVFSLEISQKEEGGVNRTLWMILTISLLTNHYTIYFREWLRFC